MMSTAKEINEYAKHKLACKFNSVMGEFMRKLIVTFPDDAVEMKACYTKVLIPIAIDKTSVIEVFQAKIKPYSTIIEQKGDEFFTSHTSTLSIFNNIDMKRNWEASSSTTKNAIWSYIQSLNTLASTYRNSGDAMETVMDAPGIGGQMLRDFESKYNRSPTVNDDISEFSSKIAIQLGINLDRLGDVNMRQLEQKIRKIDINAVLGVKMDKMARNKLVLFVVKQLRNLQRRQRLNRIVGKKENVDTL